MLILWVHSQFLSAHLSGQEPVKSPPQRMAEPSGRVSLMAEQSGFQFLTDLRPRLQPGSESSDHVPRSTRLGEVLNRRFLRQLYFVYD